MAYKSFFAGEQPQTKGTGYQSAFGLKVDKGFTPDELKSRRNKRKLADEAKKADRAVAAEKDRGLIDTLKKFLPGAAADAGKQVLYEPAKGIAETVVNTAKLPLNSAALSAALLTGNKKAVSKSGEAYTNAATGSLIGPLAQTATLLGSKLSADQILNDKTLTPEQKGQILRDVINPSANKAGFDLYESSGQTARKGVQNVAGGISILPVGAVGGAAARGVGKGVQAATTSARESVATAAFNRLSKIDESIVTAKRPSPEKVAALATERNEIIAQLPAKERKVADAITNVSKTAMNSNMEVPALARKTEARAMAKGLVKGFDDLPQDSKENFVAQVQRAKDLTDLDYKTATDIALGRVEPPEGLLKGGVYKAVENKALRTGDTETLRRLAEESNLPQQARQQGREIGILGAKDPDSPVDAIREINNLRYAAKKRGIKLPQRLSIEETDNIINLAKNAETKKQAWLDNGGMMKDPKRLEYGREQIAFRNEVDRLRLEAQKKTLKEQVKDPLDLAGKIAGNTKSLVSSMDNSALFRQGLRTLFTHPGKWAKNAPKTFSDIVKEFGGKNTLDELAADIHSRPNNVDGTYKRAKLAVGIDEEAFPEHLGEKIPLLGRAYKASEAAYVGFLQRQRADIFDKYIDIARKTGVELDDKELKSIGRMVNSLTGRGHLGKLEPVGNTLNNVFFSPRLLASHFQVLSQPFTGAAGSSFVRKQAAKNLLKIISGTAAILATADVVKPGSVEWDPRSSNFGKVKIGNTRFDVTGGSGSVAVLAARLATASKKSSTTGDVESLVEGGFGKQNAGDVAIDFFENKFSPVAGVVRDLARGENFQGEKPTPKSIATGLVTPLFIQNASNLSKPDAANPLAAMIAEGLGVSANTYTPSPNWKSSDSKTIQGFKDKIGDKKFDEANKKFDKAYNDWFKVAEKNPRYKKLTNEDRATVRTNKAQDLRDEIFKQYKYKYTPDKNDPNRLKEI